MDKLQITLVNEQKTVWARPGATLLEVQVEAGLHPDAPCGGQGTCGKCLVDVRHSDKEPWQRVKACQTQVDGPLELKTLPRDQQLRVLEKGTQDQENTVWDPWVEQIAIQVAPCPVGESTADWDRLKEALSAATGRQNWQADVVLCSSLGDLIRETGGRMWGHFAVYCTCQGCGRSAPPPSLPPAAAKGTVQTGRRD